MLKRLVFYRGGPLVAMGVLALIASALAPNSASSRAPVRNLVLRHSLEVALGQAQPQPGAMPISSGVLYTLLDQTGALKRRATRLGFRPSAVEIPSSEGCASQFSANGQVNTRVTQDCSLRAQAGESLAINPLDQTNMLVAQNDSRLGFGHCGYDWTRDGAAHWGDETPPFFQFQLLNGHTADACSDPTVTWDSQGNAYIASVLFNVAGPENAIVIAKSNAGIHGTYFHSPDGETGFQEYSAAPLGVAANDNDANIHNDKAFVVADASPSSPKRDNVYVSWTRFQPEAEAPNGSGDAPNGVRELSPIFFSQSTDGGVTWSDRVEISGEAEGICPAECFHDQGSHPVVGPDGTIYVTFANNDAMKGGEQILMVKCPADQDCTIDTSWSEPVIVSDLIGGMPTGPSSEGCPAGAACLPPNGYRVSETMSVSNSVDAAGHIYVVWADFRNNSNPDCTGPAASASGPCDNDVFYSVSSDEGETWSEPRNITPKASSRFGATAQWQPWSKVTKRRQPPLGDVLRPLLRRLRGDWLQRHHGGRDPRSGFGGADVQLLARDDRLDPEPHDREQPARGGVPRRPDGARPRQPGTCARRLGRHAPARGLGSRD